MVFPDYAYYNDMPPNKRVLDTFNNLTFPPLDIKTNITIQRIFNIDDDNSAFSVIFQVELEWNDLNLKFNYLSDSTNTIANLMDLKQWENILLVLRHQFCLLKTSFFNKCYAIAFPYCALFYLSSSVLVKHCYDTQ